MQPIAVNHPSRHLNVPAAALVIANHPTQDLSVIFLRGRYLLAIDGQHYSATKPSAAVSAMRSLIATQNPRAQLPQVLKLVTKTRMIKEPRRGQPLAHITGVPGRAFVLWAHPRVDLCMYDLPTAAGQPQTYLCWKGDSYEVLPTDRLHHMHLWDEYMAREMADIMAKLLNGREPTLI